jgi:transposase
LLTVRRFRCDNPSCKRQTFSEDSGEGLPRYARRTLDANRELLNIVSVAGAEAGSRLASQSRLPVSPDTLLRLQRSTASPKAPTPRFLGIDDFALRRRQTYGTIFVDLETRRPIDLVEGRDADTIESWLKERSGIEIIARDRSGAYADGARAGAPDARQVADRFHLLQNASTALDELLRSRRRQGEYLEVPEPDGSDRVEVQGRALSDPPSRPLSPTKQRRNERRQVRVSRWQQVKAMREAGQNISQIARTFGMCRRTVRHYLATDGPPIKEVELPKLDDRLSPKLQPFVAYLEKRWQDGCYNAAQLLREIKASGYTGSRTLLIDALHPWRSPRPTKRQRRLLRPTSVRWMVLRDRQSLKSDERAVLDSFLKHNSDIALGYDLTRQFRNLVREKDVGALDTWLAAARASGLPTLMGFANGIEADRAAVEAGLSLPWSSGPVEGNINRLKLIKRQGYGRAKFDLLRLRVLAA